MLIENYHIELSEEDLRKQVDKYLQFFKDQIKILRVHDCVWRFLQKNAPIHIVSKASEGLKSAPDYILFKGSSFCAIELKKKSGKLTKGQKDWLDIADFHVCRDFESAKSIIDEFIALN